MLAVAQNTKRQICVLCSQARENANSVCVVLFFFPDTATVLTATDKQLSILGKY